MPSFHHKKLLERIRDLGVVPGDIDETANWRAAIPHLDLLRSNARDGEEILVHTDGSPFVVNSVFVPGDHPSLTTPEETLSLRTESFLDPSATYAQHFSPGQTDISIEHGGAQGERSPLFLREYNGDPYWEVQQDYAHLAGAHYRPEESAYCRFDDHGDVEHVVSITQAHDDISMVSFLRQPLEEYLAVSGSVLVRAFEFKFRASRPGTRAPRSRDREPERSEVQEAGLFAHRIVNEDGGSTTSGTQTLRPSLTKADVLKTQRIDSWDDPDYEGVEFVVHDFRNEELSIVSTHPRSTVNYFQAADDRLPLETSPAFFNQEVLARYKQDHEKYTLDSNSITCRGGWRVRYDRNDEEQVSVILHDLGRLPYKEQVYWRSFNEEPKGGLSQRAIDVWYRGRPSEEVEPLDEVRSILWEWHSAGVPWWRLDSEDRLNHVTVPGLSRKDWADSFGELAKLIVEGFQVKAIQAELQKDGIAFEKGDGSLQLLEKLAHHAGEVPSPGALQGLRTVQKIRSKASAHRAGEEADTLWAEAQAYDSPSNHFRDICRMVESDLKAIDRTLARPTST